MSRNIRDRREPNKIVVHITARVIEGLPFVPRIIINMAIKGILAKSQTLHPVSICAFMFMGNHHHFILAGDGNRISSFMEYMQGELSKTFKRFIPEKYENSFWKDRFREQRLGNAEAVVQKLIYTFCNPLKASLVRKVEEYPGLNSFKAFKRYSEINKSYSELVPRVPVRLCKAIPSFYSKKEDMALAKEYIKNSQGYYELKITPFAWIQCFNEGKELLNENAIKKRVLDAIEEIEAEISKSRVIGSENLKSQNLRKCYSSKKNTPTPYIDCPEEELRKALIESYKSFRDYCRGVWKKIKQGIDAVADWPLGAFMPYRLFRPLRAG